MLEESLQSVLEGGGEVAEARARDARGIPRGTLPQLMWIIIRRCFFPRGNGSRRERRKRARGERTRPARETSI
jgi:hypothetical protein